MILVLILIFAAPLFGQQRPEKDPDRMERVHKGVFDTPEHASQQVSRVTTEVAPSLPTASAVQQAVAYRNLIDGYIFDKMKRDQIPHAGLSSDTEFARRVWLDATGRVPPAEKLISFLESKDPAKREKLIDQLVDSPEFVTRWTFYFGDLFRASSRLMADGLNLFHYWINEWIRLDRPYNEVVTDLLTQSAKTSYSSPGAIYFARDAVKEKEDPEAPDAHDLVHQPDSADEFTVTSFKVFMGLNVACFSCHDGKGHLEKVNIYLTSRTREQFFQQSGFFGKTRAIMNWENGRNIAQEHTVDDQGAGYDTKSYSIVRMPRRGGSGEPRFLLTGEAPAPGKDVREELARMMTSHIQFSRAFVNRIWAELMGFGIVEPLDEFDLSRLDPANPPPAPWTIQASHPELLEALAKDFQKNNYSFKHVMKTIMKSSAYQLSSRFDGEWKDEYSRYYSRKFVRMLSAAELHDVITLATERPASYVTGGDKVPTIMGMSDPRRVRGEVGNFMRVFGQSNRDELPKKITLSALQAMLLMQSSLVNDRVLAKNGSLVEKLLEKNADDGAVVRQIFLATVSRYPNEDEMAVAVKAMGADRKRGAENLQWALINRPEFIFSY